MSSLFFPLPFSSLPFRHSFCWLRSFSRVFLLSLEMKEHPKLQHQKQRQRLGSHGSALSLDAFVKAKCKPRINPSDIKKKREYYENAKKLKKYKVMMKHLSQQQPRPIAMTFSDDGAISESKDGNGVAIERKEDSLEGSGKTMSGYQKDVTKYRKPKSKKRKNALEGAREEFMKKKEEEEREKEEREKARKLKEENQAKAQQKRKELKSKMFKKTHHGQPLMKHRLEHILETIQQHK